MCQRSHLTQRNRSRTRERSGAPAFTHFRPETALPSPSRIPARPTAEPGLTCSRWRAETFRSRTPASALAVRSRARDLPTRIPPSLAARLSNTPPLRCAADRRARCLAATLSRARRDARGDHRRNGDRNRRAILGGVGGRHFLSERARHPALHLHHAETHRRSIPPEVLAAGAAISDPDERVLAMLGARATADYGRGNGLPTEGGRHATSATSPTNLVRATGIEPVAPAV